MSLCLSIVFYDVTRSNKNILLVSVYFVLKNTVFNKKYFRTLLEYLNCT